MFANLFDCELDSTYKSLPASCPNQQSPPPKRPKHGFCGITNRGATCYLNSLLQTLLFTHEFRERLFALDESELGKLEDIKENQASEEPQKSKVRIIPIQLQRLFARLLLSDRSSISTNELTDSFGWSNNEHIQQHDIQELNRILFAAINESLVSTTGSDLIPSLYHGTIVNYITCWECHHTSEHREDFFDLPLGVHGHHSVGDALTESFVTVEELCGDNRYRCGWCGRLVDAAKGAKIHTLPTILTISLLRFSYDLEKGERIKEKGQVVFPRQLDMSPYLHEKCTESSLYELFSAVVHKGGAHGGHYHAYIRDMDSLGHWDPHSGDDEADNTTDGWKTARSNKKGRRKTQQEFHDEAADRDQCWFDFNDSRVSPVTYAQVESAFSGKECAYMLFYCRVSDRASRADDRHISQDIPERLLAEVEEENKQLELERHKHDIALHTIVVDVHLSGDYEFTRGALQRKPDRNHPVTVSVDRRQRCHHLVTAVQQVVGGICGKSCVWHKAKVLPAGLHLYNLLQVQGDMSIEELGIVDGCGVFLWDGSRVQGEIIPTGECNEPVLLTLTYNNGSGITCGFPKDLTFAEFKMDVSAMVNIPMSRLLVTMSASDSNDSTELSSQHFSMTLAQLNFRDGLHISIVNKENTDATPSPVTFTVHIQNRIFQNRLTPDLEGTTYSADVTSLMTVAELKLNALNLSGERVLETGKTRLRLDNKNLGLMPSLHENQTLAEAGINRNSQLVLEAGIPPTKNQITLLYSVGESTVDGELSEVVLDAWSTVSQCLAAMATNAGFIDRNCHLRKTNWCGDAADILEDGNISLTAAGITNGDKLVLCKGNLPPKDFLQLKMLLVPSCWNSCDLLSYDYAAAKGSGDSLYLNNQSKDTVELGDLEISKMASVTDLKLEVMTFPDIMKFNLSSPDYLRLQKTEKSHLGTVLKGSKVPLRNFKLTKEDPIAVKVLQNSENLSMNHLVLNVRQRHHDSRTYSPAQEVTWDTTAGGVTIDSLKQIIAEKLNLDIESVAAAKYLKEKHVWLPISAECLQTMNPSKHKNKKVNLRQSPYFLRDGDTIGVIEVKDLSRQFGHPDDFSTEEDERHRAELEREAQLIIQKKKNDRLNHQNRSRQPEVGLSIKVDKFP